MERYIDLSETAPGEWGMPYRLTGGAAPYQEGYEDDIEARREAFFNSLAGEAVKPPQETWGQFGMAVAKYALFWLLIWLTVTSGILP